MSGIWEALFKEEPQAWSTCIASNLEYLVGVLVRLPETIVVLTMAAILIVWDFVCTQVRSVADLLQLEEWWTLEHSVFTVLLVSSLVAVLRRGRGNWVNQVSQIGVLLQIMATFGCFAWLAAGLQGGVVFGGKLFFPTLALFSLAFQVTRALLLNTEKEMYGYVEKSADSNEKAASTFKTMGRFVCLEAAFCFLVATFGFPKEGDCLSWVALFPLVGALRLCNEYTKPEAAPASVTDNGTATIIPAEEKVEDVKEPAGTETEAAKPEAVVEEKKEEAKSGEVESPTEQPEPAAEGQATEQQPEEPAKVSICQKTRNAVCNVTGKVVASVKKVVGTGVCVACQGFNKVASLPWNHIVETVAAIGASAAIAYAYWTLTEDNLVWLMPFFNLAVPVIAGKVEAKNWLSGQTTFLVTEASHVAMAATQYYLFRSNISLPF
jgi:hypothetical protein